MGAADSNVIVRIIARDDSRQAAIADRFIQQGAWVSILALAEAVWVLASVYKLSTVAITNGIEMLLNHKDLTVQDSDAVAAGQSLR